MTELLNIAIVSTNKDKYSETFIHNQVNHLPANIHFLFDGYLPKQYSTDKGRTSNFIEHFQNKKWFNMRKAARGAGEGALRLALENYLVNHNIQVILCQYGPSGVEMMDMATRLNIPLVVHFHGYDAYRDDILNSYGKQYNELFQRATAVVAVSQHMYTALQKLNCPPEKLHYLSYGIDTAIFKAEPSVEKKYDFVFCGRFVAKKSPESVIKAFAIVTTQVPNLKLVMIGDGELLDYSKHLAKNLGLEKQIEFKGVLTPEEVRKVLSESKIYVQHSVVTPQHDSEGTPLTLMECGAMALPAVATKHGGIPELIVDGETGFLVEENDIKTMAERMLELHKSPEMLSKMGVKARERIINHYSLNAYIQNLSKLLQNTVFP
ncbi:MAG: glycosyltransferase [Bacteroidia bacterium]|nr:glycosyltransferase [Bacteroidia bacterium]